MATKFHKLTTREIRQETDDTVTLLMEIPENLADTFEYAPGQYLTLRFHLDGKEERRAYSMSSSPLEDHLAVTVKRVPKGKVSTHIHEVLKAGDPVEVLPPEGKFVVRPEASSRRSFFLFGSGSGITPLMSILKTVLEEEPMSEVHLLYGSRDEDNIIFKDQLEELKQRYNGQLRLENILSRPKKEKAKGLGGLFSRGTVSWTGKVGRITPAEAGKFLAETPAQNPEAFYYICGPGDMNVALENYLHSRGIDKDRIFVEHFYGLEDPGAGPTTGIGKVDQESRAKVHLDGETFEIEVKRGQTLLDAVLDSNREAPYSCTAGACSTCVAKVLKGSVRMDTCLALDEDEVQNGLILTCQSHPTADEVEITFDDV